MTCIYSITHKDSGKVYVGKTKSKPVKRFKQHRYELNKGIHHNKYLQRAWVKYKSQAFEFKVIVEGEYSKDQLSSLEKQYIQKFNSHNENYGYNLTLGGEGRSYDNTSFFERTKTDDWALAQDIYIFWLNKSNGRGRNKHPGHKKVSQAFNIGRRTATILCQEFNKGWIPNLDSRWCKLYSAQNIKPDIIHNEAGQQRKGKEFWNEKSPEWCKAIKAYKVWSKEKLSIIKLMKRVGIKEGVSKAMVKKFKFGWCPQNDENYMKYYGSSI